MLSDAALQRDIAAIGRIDAVPTILEAVARTTGMRFCAVARVTDTSWTACAVQDDIDFGLKPGGALDLHTTLCKEVRDCGTPVVIDHASEDPRYRDHHTPRLYNIQSYISVPIVLKSGEYFGNLCAIDPRPVKLSEPRTLALFTLLAELIALQLENDRTRSVEQTALLDAHAAGELREQFIAILGHDLRNPLAAISACAEVLQRKSPTEETSRLGQRIAANARRMSALIRDVVDFARGRLGGGFGVQIEAEAGMGQALNDVLAEIQDSHPTREVRGDVHVPTVVWCDRGRVQQLASNLLANAVAHGSPHGPVRLTAAIEAQTLVLSVKNQGEPVPADRLPTLFEPFTRHGTSQGEGLGLGLVICAQIVKAHGGSLTVDSTRAEGTTLTARLPVTRLGR